MARNFYMDYSNNNPKLMDGDTGLEVGTEPKKDNNIKKLQQLKEFGKIFIHRGVELRDIIGENEPARAI